MNTSDNLRKHSYRALLAGAQEVSPSISFDANGYAPRFEQNLMNGLPLAEIVSDLAAGAGSELGGKFRAAHSSAALVVNTFGRWRADPTSLQIVNCRHFRSLRFEATCPTGLGGTPPHLDLLAEGEIPVALESKCTEWMKAKTAGFSTSYDSLSRSHGESPWFAQIRELRARPGQFQYLDAAQLVKHALGLLTVYGARPVKLLYLYWEPRNADEWPECRRHRAEADRFAARVADSNIQLVLMSYRELWADWDCPPAAPPHLAYLRMRYDRNA